MMKNKTKKCEVCGKELPLSDFSKSYKNRCRKCVADMVRSERKEKNKRNGEDAIHLKVPLSFSVEERDISSNIDFLRSISGVTKVIDWEQRRYEIAKELMKGFATNSHNQCVDATIETIAQWSVGGANALIAELKKNQQNEE